MSNKTPLDFNSIRERLSGQNGQQYWRSLDELADTPEFRDFLHREFPREASVWDETFSRRSFVKIMGASLALGGLSACVKQPEEKIIPYIKQPEILVPGKPLYYATAITHGGYAHGVLVKSHMGRPTHIEGNPDHPASLGATDVFVQAAILSLYDPDRSQSVMQRGALSTWGKFLDTFRLQTQIQRSLRGSGMRILTETITSPTMGSQLREVMSQFPEARWHQYEPVNNDSAWEGARLAYGETLDTLYRFDQANVVFSIDGDFLGSGPGHVRYAHDFSNRRRVQGDKAAMNRLYVAESTPTTTGSMADHRLRIKASEAGHIALAVARELGIGGIPESSLTLQQRNWVSATVKDLQQHRGACIVTTGMHQPPSVHALVHAINNALRNIGRTVYHTEPACVQPENQTESLNTLVTDIETGKVDMLIVLGGNPAYSSPAEMKVAEALAKVNFTVRLGVYSDETSAQCEWHIPESHSLETWSDARSYDGTTTIVQPLIAPLYSNSRSAHDILEELLGRSGRTGHDVVMDYWRGRANGKFDVFRDRSLNDGFVANTASSARQVSLKLNPGALTFPRPTSDRLEVIFHADPAVYDGRYANNGWLQELPKPLTKLTWDNAAFVSPSTAQRLGLSNEDVVDLRLAGKNVEAPVWIWMGHADDAITLHLGYGRTGAGRVGDGAGFNANILRPGNGEWFNQGLEIRKTGKRYTLASTQDHSSMEGRAIVRAGTVEDFHRDPGFASKMAHLPTDKESLYPPFAYDGYAWGMVIDLNACTGCNACVVSCQSENNIPIVGKDQVANGREMHWIRVDRYYEGDLDDPQPLTQPVMCMHCENPPCEVVCPVAATTHDSEGLNTMTYNRCVGTRYCANNCPYKVRRFNFLQYSDTETETYKMMRNPDVTVRNRGVMEKCTFCVQRISAARITAKNEDRSIRDGEVTTACQSACPAQAIAFGNINDMQSKVAGMKADPRNYGLLAELNTKPRVSYLAKLTNPNPEIEQLEQAG